jgi:predicted small secreted protein
MQRHQAKQAGEWARASGVVALLAATAIASTVAFLSGCNTTRGVGEDVEAAGEGIQELSDDVRD